MPFDAIVVRVLIASPGDTVAARRALREALDDWNSLHAENDGVMVLPVMWERDATPEMGDGPQGVINRQLVDAADVLIGVFWTRLGTPTSEAESGTAEEIDRFVKAGKPVHIYFSSEPVLPDSVDPEQHARLVEFRRRMETNGLIDRFSSPDELRRKATAAVTRTLRDKFALSIASPSAAPSTSVPAGPEAQIFARVLREREVRSFSKQGNPQYRTRERLAIENQGTASAEDLTFTLECPEDEDGEIPRTIGGEERARRLPPGGSLEYPLLTHMGTASQFEIVLRWKEDSKDYEERQTLR